MGKTAILLGATGLTGNQVLQDLLQDNQFSKVVLFSRSSVNLAHDKLEEHLIDFDNFEDYKSQFNGDVVLCCIGTTKSKTPDKAKYKKIDYGIPLKASKLSGENNIKRFLVMSSMGANRKSKVFYNRVKGEMERDVQFYQQKETYIFQPSLISGHRNESRVGETVAKVVFSVLNPILPKKIKSISPEKIASAMVHVAKNGYSEVKITSDKIHSLANNG